MRVTMSYGKSGLDIDLPDDWDVTVIRKKPMPVLSDVAKAVDDALANPIDSQALDTLAKECRTVCIPICDITRPVPNSILLPPVIRELITAGIKPTDITILIATGLHRPNEGGELEELIGDRWILDNIRIENHFARIDDDHVYLGDTKRGMPVKIDRRFVDADLRLVVGLVEPHFMAGYSGGRKLITPGIAHQDTITRFHSAQMLENDMATNCVLDNNPLHEEQLEIVDMIGDVLALNVVIDENRQISCVNFGDIRASHLKAVEFIRPYTEVPVERKFKTVVTSAAGYPLDKTYYQTVKGMVGALNILEDGGSLFIVSQCSEGMGSQEFVESQKRLISMGKDKMLQDLLQKQNASIDEWQTEMQIKAMRAGNIYLYSDCLTNDDMAITGVEEVASLEDSIRQSIEQCADKHVAVIPEGPYTIPIFRQ